MGDVIQFPAPAALEANDTAVVWRGCWSCGLVLFDDEPTLCTDCATVLDRTPAPTPPDGRPLAFYLKHFRPDGIALLAQAIIETGVAQAEEHAAAWADEHHLDAAARARFVGDVRGRALAEYTSRCQTDAELLGHTLGWGRPA